MNSILNKDTFFVKEHVGLFKLSSSYDVFDPDTRELLMECREPEIGIATKAFRLLGYKVMTPFNIVVTANNGSLVTRIKRGVSFIRSTVEVYDENDILIGKFRQRLLSIGGKFDVMDAKEQPLCTLQGKWTSWEFTFKNDTMEYAKVTKKWAGVGKEFFSTADNYVLQVEPTTPKNDPLRTLILAAVLCIDMVLKEDK